MEQIFFGLVIVDYFVARFGIPETVQSDNGRQPAELLKGRNIRTTIPQIGPTEVFVANKWKVQACTEEAL